MADLGAVGGLASGAGVGSPGANPSGGSSGISSALVVVLPISYVMLTGPGVNQGLAIAAPASMSTGQVSGQVSTPPTIIGIVKP